jgi:hypothetical protein
LCAVDYEAGGGKGAVTVKHGLSWMSQGPATRVELEDYFDATASFAGHLTHITSQHPYYLDIHAGITPVPANLGDPNIIVEERIISNPGKGSFRVLVVSQGTSPDYDKEMLAHTEEHCVFASGDVSGSKSKNRSLRFAADSDREA